MKTYIWEVFRPSNCYISPKYCKIQLIMLKLCKNVMQFYVLYNEDIHIFQIFQTWETFCRSFVEYHMKIIRLGEFVVLHCERKMCLLGSS